MRRIRQVASLLRTSSLWKITGVYFGTGLVCLELADQLIEYFFLPEHFYRALVILLLIGLLIVWATAVVQRRRTPEVTRTRTDPTLLPDVGQETQHEARSWLLSPARLFTWKRALIAVSVPLLIITLIGALTAIEGGVTVEARGKEGATLTNHSVLLVGQFSWEDEADRVVARALRILVSEDLGQSERLSILTADEALSRLSSDSTRADSLRMGEGDLVSTARLVDASAILTGEVGRSRGSYKLTVRVIDMATGEPVVGVDVTAKQDRLLNGIHAVSEQLRERLGAAIRKNQVLAVAAESYLRELENAIENEDVETLTQLWTLDQYEVDNFESFFDFVDDLSVSIELEDVEKVGDEVKLTLRATYHFLNTETGKHETVTSPQYSMTVREAGGEWVGTASQRPE